MPSKEKGVAEAIQGILDKKNGFMSVSSLRAQMSQELRNKLGIKSNDSAKILAKKLESALSESFVFRSVRKYKSGIAYYILTPCDPAEFVLALLSPDEPKTPKGLVSKLPFTYKEVSTLLNDLVEAGKVKIMFNEKLEVQVFLSGRSIPSKYSVDEFMDALAELNKERVFARICDLRRKLDWPRDVFDKMLVDLRNNETIQIHIGDNTFMTKDEIQDSFVDELGKLMGTVTRNA